MKINIHNKEYIILIVCLIIFIVFTILMAPSNSILNASTYNIVDFEFLWNNNKYEHVMASWNSVELAAAKENTFFDFGWLIGYGGIIYALNKLLSKKMDGTLGKAINFGAISGIVALSLDIIENISILNMLSRSSMVFPFTPFFVSIIALFKFLFIFYAIIIFLIGIIFLLIQFYKKKQNKL